MIAVVKETGGTNLNSVSHALQRLGASFQITGDKTQIAQASHVILPGVGAAGFAMSRLEASGLIPVVKRLRQPVLGICLGMQLLFEASEEGRTRCLGLLPGKVTAMTAQPELRVPHMGWNTLIRKKNHELLADLPIEAFYYFVHSFKVETGPTTLAACHHGEKFAAVVQRNNFFGCQFHPEKSAGPGLQLLRNFLSLESI